MKQDDRPMRSYFYYWGKARPKSADQAQYHLLPFHCLDVAAVGRVYLQKHPRLLRFFARELCLSEALTLNWISFWLVLHDLGKFTAAFQNQRADVFEQLLGCPPERIGGYPINGIAHDTLGELMWRGALLVQHDALMLGEKSKLMGDRFAPWIGAVAGHHGEPPAVAMHLQNHCTREDEQAAAAFIADMLDLLGRQMISEVISQAGSRLAKSGKKLSWWLSGLTVLADWIGSNTRYFRYHTRAMPLSRYWGWAQSKAVIALQETGVLPQPSAHGVSVQGLFGQDRIRALTPLQRWSEAVPLPAGPHLFLLEDVTGAGKTEAALTLAARLMSAGEADGLYVALPTMATANAMYARVEAVASRFFAEGSSPSLILAHGQRHLVPGFRKLLGSSERDAAQQDETASARCTTWLADHNKKALLAQLGVGTLDQAVLGILHARHQSLRLLGLFGKVLIVDEVHACDEYQRKLLCTLLRFHAEAGGSAILLSATLPQQQRQQLAQAFAKGAAFKPLQMSSSAYPLATHVHAGVAQGDCETPLDTRDEVCRSVKVESLHAEADVHTAIASALARGQCVAWIRNTVADALTACEALKVHSPALFHARFAMGDRLNTEREIERRFGSNSAPDDRRGQLVIASQVLEMSLDCDFDLLITDLAPIDRLIQRAGRLQRHRRDAAGKRIDGPDGRGGARMLVYQPAFTTDPDADWFSSVFPRAARVYPHHGQLWLTARCLQGGQLVMPGDARSFIEAVYGESEQEKIPKGLHRSRDKVEGEDNATRNFAADRVLKFDGGYQREGGRWASDELEPGAGLLDDWDAPANTRLGEPSVMVRLAAWRDGAWKPWCEADDSAWDLSALRLPARLIAAPQVSDGEVLAPTGITVAEWRALRLQLPDGGRWSPVLAFRRQGSDLWASSVLGPDGRVRAWRYDARAGLTNGRGDLTAASTYPRVRGERMPNQPTSGSSPL